MLYFVWKKRVLFWMHSTLLHTPALNALIVLVLNAFNIFAFTIRWVVSPACHHIVDSFILLAHSADSFLVSFSYTYTVFWQVHQYWFNALTLVGRGTLTTLLLCSPLTKVNRSFQRKYSCYFTNDCIFGFSQTVLLNWIALIFHSTQNNQHRSK